MRYNINLTHEHEGLMNRNWQTNERHVEDSDLINNS